MHATAAIELILSRGQKSSTYKLALLRALIDHVTEHPAQEPRNGFHLIPVIDVARELLDLVEAGRDARVVGALLGRVVDRRDPLVMRHLGSTWQRYFQEPFRVETRGRPTDEVVRSLLAVVESSRAKLEGAGLDVWHGPTA